MKQLQWLAISLNLVINLYCQKTVFEQKTQDVYLSTDWEYTSMFIVIYINSMVHFLQVGCGKDLTLFALEQGRVIVTVEKLSPYPNSPLYPAVKAGRVVLRKFYHVIPEPQRETFKLVSQI